MNMVTITINMNRVMFVVYTILAVAVFGFVGSLAISLIEYEFGTVGAAIATTMLIGAVVCLVLGLRKDLWDK